MWTTSIHRIKFKTLTEQCNIIIVLICTYFVFLFFCHFKAINLHFVIVNKIVFIFYRCYCNTILIVLLLFEPYILYAAIIITKEITNINMFIKIYECTLFKTFVVIFWWCYKKLLISLIGVCPTSKV